MSGSISRRTGRENGSIPNSHSRKRRRSSRSRQATFRFQSDQIASQREVEEALESPEEDNGHTRFTRSRTRASYKRQSHLPETTTVKVKPSGHRQTDMLRKIMNKSHPSNNDDYGRILAMVPAVSKEQEHRANSDDTDWPCRCGNGKQLEGEWVLCEDPECTILWYHRECLDGMEDSKIAFHQKWICRPCFARRKQAVAMAEIDAKLLQSGRWVDETHNQIPRDAFTGLVPYPPQSRKETTKSAQGDQVGPDFYTDAEWQRRIALQQQTREWTNCVSRVSVRRKSKQLLFLYKFLPTPPKYTANNLQIAFQCDPWKGKTSRFRLPLSRLGNRSPLVAKLIQDLKLDLNEKRTLGPFRLPNIDRETASQALNFLQGAALVVGSSNVEGSALSARSLSKLVQLSSFAHILDVPEIQKAAVHAIWHFLVLHKQPVTSRWLHNLFKRTFSGCPARAILTFVHQQSKLGWPTSLPSVSTGRTLRITDSGKEVGDIMANVLKAALSPYVVWKPALCEAISENRHVPRLWVQSGQPAVQFMDEMVEFAWERQKARLKKIEAAENVQRWRQKHGLD